MKNIFQKQFIWHTAIWLFVIIVVFFGELSGKHDDITLEFLLMYFNSFLGFIITSYVNIYFLIPRFFKKKRYFLHFLILLFSLIAFSILSLLVRDVFESSFFLDTEHKEPLSFFFHILTSNSLLVVATSFVFFVAEWIKFQDIKIKLQETEKQKMVAELNILKAQINPHFLFNTLNNLYSLSLDKSDKTPEMILKLSDLMSYIIYDCKSEKVLIKQEIEFIKNYIDLEKLRFEDKLEVQFSLASNDMSIQISPLLFIPFIENAFKYCGNKTNEKNKIDIIFEINTQNIIFNIKNSIEQFLVNDNKSKSGLGIQNVKQRLLLEYPLKHNLNITQNEDWFMVDLNIELNGN